MIGRLVSHYRILEKLGEGGMGVVYKALDTTLGRTVALKFISASAATDESMKQRLVREAKACAALNHPNITTVYEFVQSEEHEFIAIEFIEGKTLSKVLETKQFALIEAFPMALQLLDGLEAAHRKGVIHRDLKASNIMLDTNGRVKIMDFGLAKLARGSMLTQPGSTVGTAAYMSPEQARGEETDHRTDIYSLGVVLYQLLTGKLPFDNPHYLAVLYAVVNQDPKPLRELNPAIPAELENIVLKAMAKDPDRRFQSCAVMARSLLEVSEAIGGANSMRRQYRHLIGSEAGTSTETGPVTSARWSSRSEVLKYIVPGLVVVLAIAYAIVRMVPSHQNSISDARKLAKVHVDSALALMKENNSAMAFQELQSAVRADSTYGSAWANLAVLNIWENRLDLAVKQCRKAVALDRKNSSPACYNLAYAFEEIGNNEEALAWYSEAIMTDSSFTPAYCALANLYVKSNRPEEAVRLLVRFERLNPDLPMRWLVDRSYGRAHLALHNYSRAKEVLEESQQLQPNQPETLFLLASAYEALKMTKESVVKWQEYARTEKDPAKLAEALLHVEKLRKKTR